ncbi:MAG: FecR domain-containing protein [Myxococcota bacterium]
MEAVLQGFRSMEPPPLDDLSWARMSRRIMTELEARPSVPAGSQAWVARLFPAALASAVAVALVVWFTPRPNVPQTPSQRIANPAITAGGEPFEFTLESGISLRLGEHAQIRLLSGADRMRVELAQGELSVTQPLDSAELELKTPEVSALARGASFTVGYVGQETTIRVERGAVQVLGEALPLSLGPGEKRVLKHGLAAHLFPAESPSAAPVEAPRASPSAAQRPRPTPTAKAEPSIAPLGHDSVEGQTEVEVEAPTPSPSDPVAEKWRAALLARDSGEIEAAVRLANDVVLLGRGRAEERDALDLLCTAELTLGAADKAVVACEALVPLQVSAAARRQLHHRIANIYRVRLSDCAHALPHYDQTIVFGGTAMSDDDARLGRAECALELGRNDIAERDLDALKGRSERLVRKSTYDMLTKRLETARKNEGKKP